MDQWRERLYRLAVVRLSMSRTPTTSILCAILLVSLLPSAFAFPIAVDSGEVEQGVFGGLTVLASNRTAGEASSDLASLPDIAEVYTATWCENCVDVEEGLETTVANNDEPTVQLMFHRSINEIEDPFGTLEGDQRWIERYGVASKQAVSIMRAPPTIIVNGELMHAGSGGGDGDSLVPLFTASFESDTEFGAAVGSSYLSWSSDDGVTGTVNWSLVLDDAQGRLVDSLLLVVEDSAIFEEGSNGIGDYRHSVRAIHNLSGDSGELEVTLPDAWDGEDLSLVLLHQWQATPTIDGQGSSDSLIPAAGGFSLAFAAMAAAGLLGRSKARRP
jgi:hypothetical protein